MSKEEELERIRRIRDAQIQARHPLRRDEKHMHRRAAQLREGNPYTWQDLQQDIKSRWVWMIGGALVGFAIGLLFMQLVTGPYAWVGALVCTLFGVAIGRTIGALIDRGHDDYWGR